MRAQLNELNDNLRLTREAQRRFDTLGFPEGWTLEDNSFVQWFKAHEEWIRASNENVPTEMAQLEARLFNLG